MQGRTFKKYGGGDGAGDEAGALVSEYLFISMVF